MLSDLQSGGGGIARTDHEVDEQSIPGSTTVGGSPEISTEPRTVPSGRAPRRRRRRRWHDTVLAGIGAPAEYAGQQDRVLRLRLCAWTMIGIVCLVAAQWLQPDQGSLFAFPSSPAAAISLVFGFIGLWLVPGLWMSAVVMRTGAGPAAWMGTRIATTLIWYSAVGPVIHQVGQGARVTTGGIVLATTATTACVALGVLLGLSRRPMRRWLRILLPAVIGAACAQVVISASMWFWTHDMNYAHIRRLEWLIAFGCAILVTVGALLRPKLPQTRTIANTRAVLFSFGVVVATCLSLAVANMNWSPAQRMPSAFGIEQVPALPGADLAFSLTAIGAEGPRLMRQAEFSAADESGRPVPVQLRSVGADGTASRAVLLVEMPPGSQSVLCRPDRPAKITVGDRITGVRMQAVIPERWCAG
ncbi:hypothetical protein HLY00_4080 [Mycolicibacterium hippocampi]|uniref:Transmembrane protein n=2 Tax=Mycobacteriaceae TaxID=1762 RepID=A0A850PTU1_9MYCO|nr:hypothetical protein [Mycolicibacterium hippocampi]